MRGVKFGGKESATVSFDVNAKLEEKELKSGRLVVGFVLTVGTKPSVVKFEVEGVTTLYGSNPAIEKLLEVDPRTKIPLLLHRVYQRVFTTTFLLATVLDTPYPPPNILFSGEMNRSGSGGRSGYRKRAEKRRRYQLSRNRRRLDADRWTSLFFQQFSNFHVVLKIF